MPRIVPAIILCSTALSALAACSKPAATDVKAEETAIKAVEDRMRAAYKAKDPAELLANYAPDATLYVASDRPRVGKDAITENMKRDLADPAFNLSFTTAKVGVAASGDLGYTQGSFNIRYTNPSTNTPTSYSGYYLTIFKKQADGSWKAVEDMSLPAS